MMCSATLLASLLASAYGFASTPPGVTCSADEEKFFVYSIDPSLIFSFVAGAGGPDFTSNMTVTRGLVGKTWQGLQLSITQGDTTITQAGGKPLTVTSPNTLETGGFNVLSEDFCLGYGNWKVKMTAPTHPEMASYGTVTRYLTLEERRAPGAPVRWAAMPQASREWGLGLNVDVYNFYNNPLCDPDDPSSTSDPNDPTNCATFLPFMVRWAIFPAGMRAEAEAAAASGLFGMAFIENNVQKAWTLCEVDYEADVVVPASQLRRRRLSRGSSASRCG